MVGILGIEGLEGRLLRIVSIRLDFRLATKTRASSRATIATVTPIAIPTGAERGVKGSSLIQGNQSNVVFHSFNVNFSGI